MKIIAASVRNFASYEQLEIDFTGKSLTLVSGPTGSGKSTLCDIVPWVLFGCTAKDGSVDEIVRWGSAEPTEGEIKVEVNGEIYRIYRARGKSNDLYIDRQSTLTRGKDLNDTQRLINDLLGTTAEKYLSSSYYHEFSKAASFFTATAKNRRVMTEQMVDLSLAINVTEGLKSTAKNLKSSVIQLEAKIKSLEDECQFLTSQAAKEIAQAAIWEEDRLTKIDSKSLKYETFEQDREQQVTELVELSDKWELERSHEKDGRCPTCNGKVKIKHKHSNNPYTNRIYAVVSRENTYQDEIQELIAASNPYHRTDNLERFNVKSEQKAKAILDVNQSKVELADITTLGDIIDDFRGLLIKRAISELERTTNKLLRAHFDAEISVSFSADSLDKLEVEILKDGHHATFTQLSKGQRQLLKLCFGVSVMKQVANHSGISTNVAFFDEALDGLDDILKVKAFNLLQELSTSFEAVFVVEHSSALKERFTNQIKVFISNGVSGIYED